MTQEADLDRLIRQRIRGLRVSKGWSLDALAARCFLSPSTLSRIETGHRRIALDQVVPLARALGTTLDELISTDPDEDVVIRPLPEKTPGITTWLLSRENTVQGVTIAKMRIEVGRCDAGDLRVHPGREWFTVLSGVVTLHLGERVIQVLPGQAAEFSTMTPHALTADHEPAELLNIFDHDGQAAHLSDTLPMAQLATIPANGQE